MQNVTELRQQAQQAAEASTAVAERAGESADIYSPVKPVDLFAVSPLPPFPLDTLPEQIRVFASEYAAQSGFDPGAYAFCLMIEGANLIDHRTRLDITQTYSVPPFQWAAVVDPSGGGKSPVMDACAKCSSPVYQEIVEESRRKFAEWKTVADACGRSEKPPPEPPWQQRHTNNTTVEGCAGLSVSTPAGVNMRVDEFSEFLGRMDAYHKSSGSQDRANWLTAHNGGPITITRANRKLFIENWSAGILAGVQPERLATLFKRSSAVSDGLLQRFLLYVFQPMGDADFAAHVGPHTDINAINLYRQIERMSGNGQRFQLEHRARAVMQDYHNDARKLAARTASVRFREHINKLGGLLGRLTLALHVIDAAATETPPPREVPLATLERAKQILGVLYRHSESVYAQIDGQANETMILVRAAAEAILAQGWRLFNRGDLTRHATHWRDADHVATENAIDLLIEFGWIIDVTAPRPPGKRGRRSAGRFQVPSNIPEQFQDLAERIRRDRAERFQAIKKIAASRQPGLSVRRD